MFGAPTNLPPQLQTRNVVAICQGHANLLETDDGQTKTEIQSLLSTQEETDTRVILYCQYAQDQGYEYIYIYTFLNCIYVQILKLYLCIYVHMKVMLNVVEK